MAAWVLTGGRPRVLGVGRARCLAGALVLPGARHSPYGNLAMGRGSDGGGQGVGLKASASGFMIVNSGVQGSG